LLSLFSCTRVNDPQKATSTIHKNEKTIMAFFAHADDELVVSPVLAKYAKEGVNVYLVIVTDGSKGVEAHAHIPAGDTLAHVRSEEAACAAATLGINPPILLNYEDNNLASRRNIYSLGGKIDSLLNKYRPDVDITWGPDGGYGHPDHRMVSNMVTEVFQSGISVPLKQLLYVGFLRESLNSAPKLKTVQANRFRENFHTTQKEFLTYRIPYDGEDLKVSRKSLGCYKSQFTPEVMDEIFTLLAQNKGTLYFRPWNGSNRIKSDVFE